MDVVRQYGFLDEMAKLGFVPRDESETGEMIKLAARAYELVQSKTEEKSIFKTANELLSGRPAKAPKWPGRNNRLLLTRTTSWLSSFRSLVACWP